MKRRRLEVRSFGTVEKVRTEKLQNLSQNTHLSREQLVLTIKITEVTNTFTIVDPGLRQESYIVSQSTGVLSLRQ
jgi:hypothetical protein